MTRRIHPAPRTPDFPAASGPLRRPTAHALSPRAHNLLAAAILVLAAFIAFCIFGA